MTTSLLAGRRLSFSLLLVLSAALMSACGEDSAKQSVQQAREFIEAGDVGPAVRALKDALLADPDNAEARLLLSQAYLALREGASAEKEIHHVLRLGAAAEQHQVALTRALLLQGKAKEIVDQLVKNVVSGRQQLMPEAPGAKAELIALHGHALLATGTLDSAEARYDEALRLVPDQPEALLGKARLAALNGDTATMRTVLAKLHEAAPDNAYGWSLLGDLELYEKNEAAAEAAYSKSIKLFPFDATVGVARAVTRLAQGNLDGAQADVDRLRKLRRDYAGVDFVSGMIAMNRGDIEGAERELLEALRKNPEYQPAMYELGIIFLRRNQPERAISQLSRYLVADPGHSEATHALATAYLARGEYKQAEKVLLKGLERNPNDSRTLQLLGQATLAAGNQDASSSYLKQAEAMELIDADTRVQIGLSYINAGDIAAGQRALAEARKEKAKEQIDSAGGGLLAVDVAEMSSLLRAGKLSQAIALGERAAIQSPDSPLPMVLLGLAHLRAENDDAAKAAFESALERDKSSNEALAGLAQVAIRSGNLEAAARYYEQSLKINPEHLRTLLSYAEVKARSGDIKSATGLLRRTIELHPSAVQPYVLLARFANSTGRAEAARRHAETGLKQAPDNSALLTELTKAQLSLGYRDRALATSKRLVESDPESADAHTMLAKVQASIGDIPASTAATERALALEPDNRLANVWRSRLSLTTGDVDGARARLERMASLFPEDPLVMGMTGEFHRSQGEHAKALTAFTAAYKRAPRGDYAVARAQSEWNLGNRKSALKTLEQHLARLPEDSFVQFALTELLAASGETARTVKALERASELMPENPLVLNNLAWQLRNSDPDRALGLAQRATKFAPDNATFLDTLGMLHLWAGRPASAVEVLTRAAGHERGQPIVWMHLAEALAASGDTPKAVAILDKLLGTDVAFSERKAAEMLRARLR